MKNKTIKYEKNNPKIISSKSFSKAFKKNKYSFIDTGRIKEIKKVSFFKKLKKPINPNESFYKIFNSKKSNDNKIKNTYKLVDVKRFNEIRRYIYYNFKKPYTSPYIERFIIYQKYSNDLIKKLKLEPAKYYDYYQICYLMNKNIKNYRLISRFCDYLLYYDDQEYIMKYFNKKEQYIIMKYLLYQVYDSDKLVKAHIVENIPYKDIKIDFNALIGKYFKYYDDFNIDKNEKYIMSIASKPSGKILYINKLKPTINSFIQFIYIKDIPKSLIPKISANLFPHFSIQNFNLEIYAYLRKYTKKKKLESLINFNKINYRINYLKNAKEENQKENDFEDSKENIFNNSSFSSKEKKEDIIKNLAYKNEIKNNNNNLDKDIKEIENFIKKLNFSIFSSKNDVEKKLSFKNDKLKYKQIKKLNSILKRNKEDSKQDIIVDKKNENIYKDKIENRKNLNINKKNRIIKFSHKDLFKTTLNGSYTFSKFDKSISYKSIFNKYNSKNKEEIHKINSNEKNFHLTSRQEKNRIKNKIKKINYKPKNKNRSNYNNNIISDKVFIPRFSSSSHEIVPNSNKLNKYSNNLISTNLSSIFFNPSKSKSYIQENNVNKNKTFFEYSIKLINKSHIHSLKNFEKLYQETKKNGLLPKTNKNFSQNHHKPFEGIYGYSFIKNSIKNDTMKEIEIYENKSKNDYLSEKLKINIKKILKRKFLYNKNKFSLSEIIKSPNFYGNNET